MNQVCDHALVLSAVGGHTQIGAEAIEEAWSDLQQLPAPWHQTSRRDQAHAAPSTAIEFGQLQDDEAALYSTMQDGAEAAEFMQAVKAKLEAPLRLVL